MQGARRRENDRLRWCQLWSEMVPFWLCRAEESAKTQTLVLQIVLQAERSKLNAVTQLWCKTSAKTLPMRVYWRTVTCFFIKAVISTQALTGGGTTQWKAKSKRTEIHKKKKNSDKVCIQYHYSSNIWEKQQANAYLWSQIPQHTNNT